MSTMVAGAGLERLVRERTPSSMRLATALRERGLATLALNAEQGFYDDFDSPLPMPKVALIADLRQVARENHLLASNVADMIRRVEREEFDNSREEFNAWARSPVGQHTLRELGVSW